MSINCLKAQAGTFVNGIGKSLNTTCPAGYYCLLGQATPIACPEGTVSVEGATSLASCLSVPFGRY